MTWFHKYQSSRRACAEHRWCRCKCWILVLWPVSAAATYAAGSDLPALCEDAARVAAAESGVPLSVMQAIALTESGRRVGSALRPWPWTVNMQGTGRWFATAADARAFVDRHVAAGARSFDVGCFQINYRWHGQAFSSIEAMIEPLANARYAARFLRALHAESADWSVAAGAYHSRTPEYADQYRARFDRIRASLDAEVPPAAPPGVSPTQGRPMVGRGGFPLLVARSGPVRMGSLVPVDGTTGNRRLFDLGRKGS